MIATILKTNPTYHISGRFKSALTDERTIPIWKSTTASEN
jgi:hypothetical protein